MDRSQFIVIAVTAATTAAITVVVKTLTEWLVSLLKLLPANDTTRAAVKTMFSKANMLLLFSITFFGVSVLNLIHDLHESGPVTREVVLRLCLATIGVLLWSAAIIISTILVRIERRGKK